MKQLNVPMIDAHPHVSNIYDIGMLLDKQEKHLVEIAPWSASTAKPEVSFAIAHARKYLLLKYYVRETYLRAANFSYNSRVFEDSCVECFLSFDEEENYYNLEMNCIGALLMGYGKGKENRELASAQVLSKIARQVAITHHGDNDMISWELTARVPLSVFTYTSLSDLGGTRCRANFYKCGDCLPDPHFLCWSPIKADQPNFHLPAFFGELHFL